MAVRVERRDDGEPVYEGIHAVGAERAVAVVGIAADPGSCRVGARFSRNGVSAVGRIGVDLPGVDRAPNVDVVSAAGGLYTRRLPAFEPI